MPGPENCRFVQGKLLDWALDAPGRAIPDTIVHHLTTCSTCRAYCEGLHLAPNLWSHQPLYHGGLRAKVVARVEEEAHVFETSSLRLLIPALTLLAVIGLIVPVWLLSEALSLFFESSMLCLGLSLFLAYSLGGAAASLCTVPFAARVARGRLDTLSGGAP